jgi:tRNA pseudouridine32 synthase / 23S rRNA pseudouridine746 synthase
MLNCRINNLQRRIEQTVIHRPKYFSSMLTPLYDNDDIVAIDKPTGISSIPERDLGVESVLTILEKQLGQKLFIVHRLDKEVSGVLLFARNAAAHRFLSLAFEKRAVKKTYRAIVHGRVADERGVIDKPLRQFGSGRMGVDESKGKPCVTEFAVIERNGDFTLLNAFPLTGRRHQIRVHLYSIGHPIAGDPLYGDKAVQQKFPRLLLHAEKIELDLPTGKRLEVCSKVPEEFGV